MRTLPSSGGEAGGGAFCFSSVRAGADESAAEGLVGRLPRRKPSPRHTPASAHDLRFRSIGRLLLLGVRQPMGSVTSFRRWCRLQSESNPSRYCLFSSLTGCGGPRLCDSPPSAPPPGRAVGDPCT